jgi:hypothetical protein
VLADRPQQPLPRERILRDHNRQHIIDQTQNSAADNAYLQPDPKLVERRTGDEMRKPRKQQKHEQFR